MTVGSDCLAAEGLGIAVGTNDIVGIDTVRDKVLPFLHP